MSGLPGNKSMASKTKTDREWHVSEANRVNHTISRNGPNPEEILWECACGNKELGPLNTGCPQCGKRGDRHPIRYNNGGE